MHFDLEDLHVWCVCVCVNTLLISSFQSAFPCFHFQGYRQVLNVFNNGTWLQSCSRTVIPGHPHFGIVTTVSQSKGQLQSSNFKSSRWISPSRSSQSHDSSVACLLLASSMWWCRQHLSEKVKTLWPCRFGHIRYKKRLRHRNVTMPEQHQEWLRLVASVGLPCPSCFSGRRAACVDPRVRPCITVVVVRWMAGHLRGRAADQVGQTADRFYFSLISNIVSLWRHGDHRCYTGKFSMTSPVSFVQTSLKQTQLPGEQRS